MWLQGKTGNARVSHVSLARTKGNESLTLLVSGDHGVTEYEVAPKEEGQTAPRKRREIGSIGPVALATSSSAGYIALVGSTARADYNPRRVAVFNENLEVIHTRQFLTPILGIQCSRKGHLAVCLGDRIHWYFFTEKDSPAREVPTVSNPDGIFALSDDGKLLAYPIGKNLIGVQHGDEEVARIETEGSVGKLRFNPKGGGQDLLAASSTDGKTVWVWSLLRMPSFERGNQDPTHTLMYSFSRSRTHACHVEGLEFNAASSMLALSGDSGTVHVFELSEDNKVASGYGAYVPAWVPTLGINLASSRFKVRSGSAVPSLVGLLVADSFIEGPGASRSVFIIGADGSLTEFELPTGLDPQAQLETDTPIRKERIY